MFQADIASMDYNSPRNGFLTTLLGGLVAIPLFFVLFVLLAGLGIVFVIGLIVLVLAAATFVVVMRFRTEKFLNEYYKNYDPRDDED